MADRTSAGAPADAGAARHRLRAAVHRHLARHPRAAALADRLTPRSVRARTTLAACASVAVVLCVASVAVVLLLRGDLERGIEADAREQARAVARLAGDGRLTGPLPLDHGTDFIQVVDAHGRVVAASQNLTGRPPLARSGRPRGRRTFDLDAPGHAHRHHQRVTSIAALTPTGPVTIYVGASLRTADAAENLTTAALAVLSTVLLFTVGILTWRDRPRPAAGRGHPRRGRRHRRPRPEPPRPRTPQQ